MKPTPNDRESRVHRVVKLTIDEAAYLARPNECRKCGHNHIFHNHGNLNDGGSWRSCNLCDCIDETPGRRHLAPPEMGPNEGRVWRMVAILTWIVVIGAVFGRCMRMP
jgi:hypothetical protein